MNQTQVQAALSRFGGLSLREFSIIIALMLPTTMALIEVGMIGVALPVIQAEFGIPVDLLSWVMAVGYLLRVPLMPIYGRVGDVFGKKHLYLIGLVIFVMGALIAATAQTFDWLIWADCCKGLAARPVYRWRWPSLPMPFPRSSTGARWASGTLRPRSA
jgi:MFS family permease